MMSQVANVEVPTAWFETTAQRVHAADAVAGDDADMRESIDFGAIMRSSDPNWERNTFDIVELHGGWSTTTVLLPDNEGVDSQFTLLKAMTTGALLSDAQPRMAPVLQMRGLGVYGASVDRHVIIKLPLYDPQCLEPGMSDSIHIDLPVEIRGEELSLPESINFRFTFADYKEQLAVFLKIPAEVLESSATSAYTGLYLGQHLRRVLPGYPVLIVVDEERTMRAF